MTSFASYIKQARKDQCLSLRGAAIQSGMSPTMLSRLELGLADKKGGGVALGETLIRSLAKALKLNAEELLVRSGRIPKDIAGALREDPSLIGAVRAVVIKRKEK